MLTHHAQVRAQQRAIPPLVVDLLLQFGKVEKAVGHAQKIFFDKAARKRLGSYAGPLAPILNQHMDVYAVLSESGAVITVSHRTMRIKHH